MVLGEVIHICAVSNPFVKAFRSSMGRKGGLRMHSNNNDCVASETRNKYHSRCCLLTDISPLFQQGSSQLLLQIEIPSRKANLGFYFQEHPA